MGVAAMTEATHRGLPAKCESRMMIAESARMAKRGGAVETMAAIPRYRPHARPILLSAGFRPFLLGAAVWAPIGIPLWLLVYGRAASCAILEHSHCASDDQRSRL